MTDDEGTTDPLTWTTTATGIDYACPGFDVRRDEVTFPDGRSDDYHYVDESPAVVVLPFVASDADGGARESTDGGSTSTGGEAAGGEEAGGEAAGGEEAGGEAAGGEEVVVIEEWRQAVGRVNRGLPAGSMERGEDVEAAARRELAEETGYEAASIEALVTVEPSNGIANSVHHHVVARGCTPTAERALDHNESIRVDTAAYDDLVAAAVAGDLRDGRAVLALLVHASRE
jgi:ADP-ribose pyrophosphatase